MLEMWERISVFVGRCEVMFRNLIGLIMVKGKRSEERGLDMCGVRELINVIRVVGVEV